MKANIVAIIPARGGSKGIPRKNVMQFCGKPLIAWSIMQALGSKYIDDVYVTSDDPDILNISKKAGAKTILRPAKLALDGSSTEDALKHALLNIGHNDPRRIDGVILLQATSPLRTSADIDGAIEVFMQNRADSIFSAAVLDDFCLWSTASNKFKSVTYDYRKRGRRQDRRPYYLENGSIYVFKPNTLFRHNNRLGGKIGMFGMPYWKSYEIDKPEDIELCEYFMRRGIIKR
jgi:CMP-N-acetylneuraminic acid synthetase